MVGWREEGKDRGRMPSPPAQHFLGHRTEIMDRKDGQLSSNLAGRMTEDEMSPHIPNPLTLYKTTGQRHS